MVGIPHQRGLSQTIERDPPRWAGPSAVVVARTGGGRRMIWGGASRWGRRKKVDSLSPISVRWQGVHYSSRPGEFRRQRGEPRPRDVLGRAAPWLASAHVGSR